MLELGPGNFELGFGGLVKIPPGIQCGSGGLWGQESHLGFWGGSGGPNLEILVLGCVVLSQDGLTFGPL